MFPGDKKMYDKDIKVPIKAEELKTLKIRSDTRMATSNEIRKRLGLDEIVVMTKKQKALSKLGLSKDANYSRIWETIIGEE